MNYLKIKPSTTKLDLKKQYKLAAQKHHPDKGGNHDDFIKLQKEYDEALLKISKPVKKKRRFKPYSDAEINWMLREFDKLSKTFNKKKKKPKKG